MATVEDALWQDLVKKHLAAEEAAGLPKKEQQTLALALQEWTARSIHAHLENIVEANGRPDLGPHLAREPWRIHFNGKRMLGGVRWQEVDVWMTNSEAGLVLAVDPKHFQSADSLNKNWKNGHNDLVAFATNLHERFPECAVGGVVCFPHRAASPQVLKQMHGICSRSIPRERPTNAYGEFEGFGLAVYDSKGNLVWPFTAGSPLTCPHAFETLARAVHARTLGLV